MWQEAVQLLLLLAGTGIPKGIAVSQCSSGFPSPDQLTAMLDGNVVHRNFFGRQWLFPNMNFSCEGAVTSWIIGAEWVDGRTNYTEMQIWRLTEPSGSIDTYEIVGRVELRLPVLISNDSEVYEYTVDTPMSFRAGDVIGMFEPKSAASHIQLYFKEGQGLTNYFAFSDIPFSPFTTGSHMRQDDVYPLIAVVIDISTSQTSSSPFTTGQAGPEGTATSQETEPTSGVETATMGGPVTSQQIVSSLTTPTIQSLLVSSSQSAPEPFPPANGATGSASNGGLIAGVVVAIMVMIIIATGMVIVGFALVLKKRRKRSELVLSGGHTVSPLDNPVYSPGATTGLLTPHDYERPQYNSHLTSSVPNGVSQDSAHMYDTVESGGGKGVYRVYGTTDTGQSKEMDGIHVPTKFQRRQLRSSLFASSSEAPEVYDRVYSTLAETQQCSSFFEEAGVYWTPSSDSEQLYEQLATKKYREIQRSQIQIISHLGSGQFGTVNKGIWQSLRGAKEVAVKMLIAGSSEEDKVRFLQEAAINGQFRHINVVRLLGVVTLDEPVMIVLEYLMNGDLRMYLIKQRPPTGATVPSNVPGLLLGFCRQIAAGMAYLSQKGFVHRDLAARNVLIGEDKTCKISDFGLSKDLENESYYLAHGGQIPVKWTAPEAILFKKYTTASDVWSYGVLMYEIWSLGHKPFEGYTNAEALELANGKQRLPPPPGCPRAIYEIMIMCWHPDHQLRPTFQLLSEDIAEPQTELLAWTEDDIRTHPLAATLGAALEAGQDLYSDLRGKYLP